MSKLQRYDNNGLELVIDKDTGESYATVSGYARMSGKDKSTISRRAGTVALKQQKMAEILTPQGLRTVALIDESTISDWIIGDNPGLAKQMMKAGVRVFLHHSAGHKIKSEQPHENHLELPPTDVRIHNLFTALKGFDIDIENPRYKQAIQDLVLDKIVGYKPLALSSSETWCGVAERAEQLGFPVCLVTRHRSSLGKYVKAHSTDLQVKQEKRLCNGTQRLTYLYKVSETLDNLIREYLSGK